MSFTRNILFFPPPDYVPEINNESAVELATLCGWAGEKCKASGKWTQRKVSWEEGDKLKIIAQPGHMGDVHVVLPDITPNDKKELARRLLLVMAYGLFDGVAKESIKGTAWSKDLSGIKPNVN